MALCCALLLAGGAKAEIVQELAKAADWELVKVEDPFAEIAVQCQIRTRTIKSGGRRERPLIIFDLTSRRIAVRPDIGLQGSIMANRALQGRTGDRGGRHPVKMKHAIRIDAGKLYTISAVATGSGSLEVHFDSAVYDALSQEVMNGKVLHYLWWVASSRKGFKFQLDGLRQLFPTARKECPKLKKT